MRIIGTTVLVALMMMFDLAPAAAGSYTYTTSPCKKDADLWLDEEPAGVSWRWQKYENGGLKRSSPAAGSVVGSAVHKTNGAKYLITIGPFGTNGACLLVRKNL